MGKGEMGNGKVDRHHSPGLHMIRKFSAKLPSLCFLFSSSSFSIAFLTSLSFSLFLQDKSWDKLICLNLLCPDSPSSLRLSIISCFQFPISFWFCAADAAWRYPVGCNSSGCEYEAQWWLDETTHLIKFNIVARQAITHWTAIAFAPQPTMVMKWLLPPPGRIAIRRACSLLT